MHVFDWARLIGCWCLLWLLCNQQQVAANQQTYRPHKRRSAYKSVPITCNAPNKTGPPPDVFWLNLDKSFERRELFEIELARAGLLVGASRIRGRCACEAGRVYRMFCIVHTIYYFFLPLLLPPQA